MYEIEPGSPAYAEQTASLVAEALLHLSPNARHANVVQLLGVVVGGDFHAKSLVFELAEEGSLARHIARLLAPGGRSVHDCHVRL